jgi:GDP-4-dehydro-6-deoxy-D-mannose reductase
MRALVTGGNGFVGRYLTLELRSRGVETLTAARYAEGAEIDLPLDLADLENVRGVVELAAADVVFHLAAQAFVPEATRAPLDSYETNVAGTARLVEAIRGLPLDRRPLLVFISSGEVYGSRPAAEQPLREVLAAQPLTPYAASKAAAEAIVLASARTYGFRALVTRAFNHIGPGQSELFAVPAFAKRLAAIAAGGDARFPVGNLSAQRDFLDVRDVVRAYADLALHGSDGEIYNVCSGVPRKMEDVLRTLVTIARVGVEIREDPALVRPVDVPLVYGDNAKLRAATGWEPAVSFARSLRDVYEAAREAAPRSA